MAKEKAQPRDGDGVRRLIVELKPSRSQMASEAFGMEVAMTDSIAELLRRNGATPVDANPVLLPSVAAQSPMEPGFDSRTRFDVSFKPESRSVMVVAEGDAAVAEKLMNEAQVIGVFADLPIEPCLICPGSPPMGNTTDVANLLCTAKMQGKGMDGTGVLVAIVDTGINKAHLAARGIVPAMDIGRSWVPGPGMVPFDAPLGHGTMCAFDALIAAPRATLLDIQLLRSTIGGGFSGFLSDAVRAYAHLQSVMQAPRRPGELRSLVVNNSWGMFHPSWDLPVGNPGNYSDNPNHPFNRAVAALEALGADILFAAGNCGANCPDSRCQGVTSNAIYGANGHPSVLTIAGVDISKLRVGYSSQGPGRLSRNKPDVCGYTHFSGSGVYAADGGTSAACPVVTGVVAAVRTRRPYQPGNPSASPHAIRELLRSTAEDRGASGFDFDYGWGIVNGCAITDRMFPRIPIDICRILPDLCRPRVPIRFCERYPDLCRGIPRQPHIPPHIDPGPIHRRGGQMDAGDPADMAAGEPDLATMLGNMWEMGYRDGQAAAAGKPATDSAQAPGGGCGCGGQSG